MQVKILQKKQKGKSDSFWYNGDIAEIKDRKRIVIVSANGEIRIYSKEGELVHDGFKTRNNGFPEFKNFEPLNDKDLAKLEALGYTWENNNWFECFYAKINDFFEIGFGKLVILFYSFMGFFADETKCKQLFERQKLKNDGKVVVVVDSDKPDRKFFERLFLDFLHPNGRLPPEDAQK